MPNHIENHLTIEGPQDELDALAKRAAGPNHRGETGEKFTFNAFVPMPPDVSRESIDFQKQKELGLKHWYEWSCHFWGTKWDCYEITFKKEKDPILDQMAHAFAGKNKKGVVFGRVLYTFQTAWSAPHPVVKKIAEEYPNLRIKHEWSDEDTSGENHGRALYQNGKVKKVERFDGGKPTHELEELATRLHGRNPYLPSCEDCGDELTKAEIKSQKLEGLYGICNKCKK